ncbi:hypothetical protein WG66_009847 [Moniliophthora roreri]|nr:hypothetical protein WG66_009847 [Moniliophthora roreri]
MLLPIRTNKPLLWALGFDPKALVYSTSTDPQRAQYHVRQVLGVSKMIITHLVDLGKIMILRTRAKVDSALDQSSGLFSAFLIRRGARPCPQEVENVDTNELRGHSVCMSLQPGVDTLFQHDNSAHLTCAAEASKFLSAPVTVRMNIEVVCEACEVPSSQARPDVTESVVSSMASYKVPDPSARTGASNEIVTSTLAGIWLVLNHHVLPRSVSSPALCSDTGLQFHYSAQSLAKSTKIAVQHGSSGCDTSIISEGGSAHLQPLLSNRKHEAVAEASEGSLDTYLKNIGQTN